MATIRDVARRAGVSLVTVSRVINGANHVNASTREKVEQAIAELGYLPNLAARSLRSRKTRTLALIIPDVTNAFWTTVSRGVEDAAQSAGYSVLVGNTDESLLKQTGYLRAMLQQRVDGVLIAPVDSDAVDLRALMNQQTPTVVIDRRVKGWEVDCVRTDSVSGAYALTRHLIHLGHRLIAIVTGPVATSTAEERLAGYCLALQEAGIAIDPLLIRQGEFRYQSGRSLTDRLFAEGVNPTAILAGNNVMAMGVLESLRDHGKAVPQDIALVCFDELPDLARFFPFLTALVQPAYEMGKQAANLLLERVNGSVPEQPRLVILPSRLLLRYSCGRLTGEREVQFAPLADAGESRVVEPFTSEELAALQAIPGLKFQ